MKWIYQCCSNLNLVFGLRQLLSCSLVQIMVRFEFSLHFEGDGQQTKAFSVAVLATSELEIDLTRPKWSYSERNPKQ